MRFTKAILLAAWLAASIGAAPADEYVAKLKPGDAAPAMLGSNLEGDDVSTSAYAGKILVVTFWASWCGPCQRELPLLEGIQRAAGKERVQVVAINIEDHDTYRRLARGLKKGFVSSINFNSGGASEAFGVKGIPHLVLVGRDGKVIAVHRGYSEEGIDDILAEINRALAG